MLRYIFFLCLSVNILSSAQEIDCYDGRYKSEIFEASDIIFEDHVKFATVTESNGQLYDLTYNVYYSKIDTLTERPVFVLAHGGAFLKLIDQRSPEIVHMANKMAQRGYVVVTIDYRQESNVLSLFSEEKMIKAVGMALADIRNVTCHLMDTTLFYNNPYGIDPSKVILGGVSAGSIAFLQALFLDHLDQLPEQYKNWILEVVPNSNELLANKYCGANVLGLVNISGAILDTNWIDANKIEEYPALYHLHGTADPIVPYGYAHPLGINNLPKLMGSKLIHRYASRLGIPSEIDVYLGQGHAPVLGVDWRELFSGKLEEFLIHPIIMPATINRMTDFAYQLIDCNEVQNQVISGINQSLIRNVKIFPNPSEGVLNIELPAIYNEAMELSVFDVTGKVIEQSLIDIGSSSFQLETKLVSGIYHVVLKSKNEIFSTKLFVN